MVRDIFVIFGRFDFVVEIESARKEDVLEREADVDGQTFDELQEFRSMSAYQDSVSSGQSNVRRSEEIFPGGERNPTRRKMAMRKCYPAKLHVGSWENHQKKILTALKCIWECRPAPPTYPPSRYLGGNRFYLSLP